MVTRYKNTRVKLIENLALLVIDQQCGTQYKVVPSWATLWFCKTLVATSNRSYPVPHCKHVTTLTYTNNDNKFSYLDTNRNSSLFYNVFSDVD